MKKVLILITAASLAACGPTPEGTKEDREKVTGLIGLGIGAAMGALF